jgi:predicted nucleotidyltransferase
VKNAFSMESGALSSLFRTPTIERIAWQLYLDPSRAFTLGEIAAAVGGGVTQRTVINSLDRLVEDGFASKDGARRPPVYKANNRSFAFDELRSLAIKGLGAGPDLAAAVAASPDVIGAAVYGSTASGTARADSDIDVLLVVRDPSAPSLADLTSALYEAGMRVGREVNFSVFGREEFWAKRGSGFLARVLAAPLAVIREDEPLFGPEG